MNVKVECEIKKNGLFTAHTNSRDNVRWPPAYAEVLLVTMNDGIKGAPTRKKSLGHPASSARSQSHTIKVEHLIHMKIMHNMIKFGYK